MRVRFAIYLRQCQRDLLIRGKWDVKERERPGMTPECGGPWASGRVKSPLTEMGKMGGGRVSSAVHSVLDS